tara:strand:+ start:77 stop:610 length:534 start_codon:yes stop_codon:yes gene_type:complete
MNLKEDIFIYKIPNFENLKEDLLKSIKKSNSYSLNTKGEKITSCDYNFSKETNRPYVNFIYKNIISDFGKNFCIINNIHSIGVDNIWFQIYMKNDFHNLHTHPHANFTNVLYVKLPNKNLTTNVYNLKKEKISLNIEEGNILTFPAYYPHSSPKNILDDEKIIVSFNTNVNIETVES